jgi:hypothetical protein
MRKSFAATALVTLAVTLLGCAERQIKETEDAPPGFVNGTLVLAEVGGVITRETIFHPPSTGDWTHLSALREKLLAIGYADADIVDGSEVGARTFCYAHNSKVGCRHWGVYAAHVPPELRKKLTFSLEHNQKVRAQGDLIEIELRETPAQQLVGTVVAIYRKSGDWGNCRWATLDYKGLAETSPFGPPIAMWLECGGLVAEGWVKRRIPGSPPSGPGGSPDRYVHEWIKIPRASPSG